MRRVLDWLRLSLASGHGMAVAQPRWNRLQWMARRWLRRLDWPGVLAIGILAMCPAFYFSAILPEQARMDAARHSMAALHEQAAAGGALRVDARLESVEQLAVFYQRLPDEGSSSQWLGKLMALAASRGLSLNDGEYKATRDRTGKLLRYQMILPVQGSYPQIRTFLTDLPEALPAIALENVQFERQNVADPYVKARIKLALYLEQAS